MYSKAWTNSKDFNRLFGWFHRMDVYDQWKQRGGIRIWMSEVKFLDYSETNNCEGIYQKCFCRSRTKVKGSKRIRYPPSLNYKLYHLENGKFIKLIKIVTNFNYNHNFPVSSEKSKFFDSGGSMIARLKLKGIDGTVPPGVECAA